MGRRLLSHLLILSAVFMLTATFFMWTIDNRVLNAEVLSGELRRAGVSHELSVLLPEIVTSGAEEMSPEDKVELEEKISKVITADYIDDKIYTISDSLLVFVRNGSPQPTIDISDFPDLLRTAGVEVDPEFDEKFPDSIELNKNGELDKLTTAYSTFNLIKYAGLVVFILLMVAEWFVAERGQKLRRISRVFLYAGLWYVLYWLALVVVPAKAAEKLGHTIGGDFDATGLIHAVLRSVQGLFSSYFLGFAIVCLTIAVVLYIIRHLKHGDVLTTSASPQTSPKTRSNSSNTSRKITK